MRTSHNTGFTIIETMLFLGISGLLVVALLAGTGASINNQRYRDSVNTFTSFLQQQYSEVNNVSNQRGSDWSCGDDGAQPKQSESPEFRGQSKCFIAGRFIIVDKNGGIATVPVTGLQIGTSTGSDISMLINNYSFGLSTFSKQDSSLEWDAKLSWPVEGAGPGGNKPVGTPRAIGILILRSPDSGSTYTFTYDPNTDSETQLESITSDFIKTQIMKPNTSQSGRTICVDSASGTAVGDKLAVFIGNNASNSSSIETRSYQTIRSLNNGGGPKC